MGYTIQKRDGAPEAIETVEKHCKHKDCKFRGHMTGLGLGVHWCMYMYVTGKPRNSSISECDKYCAGRLKVKTTTLGMKFEDLE